MKSVNVYGGGAAGGHKRARGKGEVVLVSQVLYAPSVAAAWVAWTWTVAWAWAVAWAIARIGRGGQEVIKGNGTGDAPEQDAGREEEQGGVEGDKWTRGGIAKDEEQPGISFTISARLVQSQVSIWVVVGCKDAGGEEQGSENMQERAVHSRVTRKSLHCKRCHSELLG